jgi:hypothetical protein
MLGACHWVLRNATFPNHRVFHHRVLCTAARGQAPSAAPDGAVQLMLIRNTLTLVNHGNLTGNYTVLRDLASEQFRQRNTAGDLAATFANLRQQKLDLSPVLVTEPQLAEPPREIAPGRLQMVGQFATRPQAVQFALVFQRVAAGWMIDEISLRVAPAETRLPPAQPQSPAPPARPTAAAPIIYPQTGPYSSPTSDYRGAERDRTFVPQPTKTR